MSEETQRQNVANTMKQLWTSASLSDRTIFLSGLLALLSPFFPWYYLCTRVPGMYECERWNGFQMDNDIFGLFVFITAAVTLLSILWQRLGRTWSFIYSPGQVQLISGLVLLAIGILRLISFRGESSSTIGIGPNVGLVFVLFSGIGIIAGKELDRLTGYLQKWRSQPTANQDATDAEGYDYDMLDDELDELLDADASENQPTPPRD